MSRVMIIFLCVSFYQITYADSGTYKAVFSGSSNMATISMPEGKATSGSLSGTETVIKSSGAPFLEGESVTGDCVLYLERIQAGTNLSGRCTMIHSVSGDELYFSNSRKVGDTNAGSGGEGKSTMVGGTGRYAGISGSCGYVVKYLPDNKFAAIQQCEWSK